MNLIKIKYAILLLLLVQSLSAMPSRSSYSPDFNDWMRSGGSIGLIDPSKLTIDHNVSFGYASGSNGSLMQSMYATQFGYSLSDPVKLTFLFGIQNNQLNGTQLQPMNFNSMIGGARLDYNPGNNFHLRLEFMRSPGSPYSNQFMNISPARGMYHHSPWLIRNWE